MPREDLFYIDGEWVTPHGEARLEVVDPATEETIALVPAGTPDDVDRAVKAARAAFPGWSETPVSERAAVLRRIVDGLAARAEEIGVTISREMGMPRRFATTVQAALPRATFESFADLAASYPFTIHRGGARVVREPIGVCGFITPWNFPLHQIAGKVAPALAAGCTMVLKPSELAPLNAVLLAEIMDEAGVPPGVFNLVQGEGPTVGEAIASHPDVDMVSITGSTRAGIAVAKAAADTVKRVTQELGGKSANIILEDADLEKAVAGGVRACFFNSGQACNAPTRMLLPAARYDEAAAIARRAAEAIRVGDPSSPETFMGPLVGHGQYAKVQRLIGSGIEDGARLLCGGPGKPDGLDTGFYVRPTVFADVDNAMTIAQEEIFGPVLCLLRYHDDDDAVRIANQTVYGLAAWISGADQQRAERIAGRLRAGQVVINNAPPDFTLPFGGYRMSGNGREFGEWGLEEFLETKAILGAVRG